jgi:peptide/nickel transport system permease protein
MNASSEVLQRAARRRALRRFARDPFAVGSAVLLVAVAILAIISPWLSGFDPYTIRPQFRFAPPGSGPYWLGGDELGRDVLARLVNAARPSLIIGFGPTLVGLLLGGFLGLIAGYFGGVLDDIVMRILEVALAFPSILLAIGIAAAIGPSLTNIVISLSVICVPFFARVVRSAVLSVREREFVVACEALGAKHARIIWHHILPQVASPLIVLVSIQAGRMILMGAGLSFLGLGIRPPDPDWGSMLGAGQRFLSVAPHVATIPGLVIFVVTICLNLVGDALRDALDPRS